MRNLETSGCAPLRAEPLATLSRAALDVFASTHNFFALHLVTGAHAYRMLQKFTGAQGDAVFTLGIVAGYAAVGAPEFGSTTLSESIAAEFDSDGENLLAQVSTKALASEDEHDIKLAFSAGSQAAYWQDAAYLQITSAYLARKSG